MKRTGPAILTTLLAAALCLSGCSRSAKSNVESMNVGGSTGSMTASAPAASYKYLDGYEMDSYAMDEGSYDYEFGAMEQADNASGTLLGGGTGAQAETYDKIIYSGSASVETIHFEETVKQVYELIGLYDGFLESSYVTGRDYHSSYYDSFARRNASFTIRIPRDRFQSFTGELETLGNLTHSSLEAQNITTAYRDTESRLRSYRTQETRLLEMLEKAETVEDMLYIEDRLSSVRYNIESLTGNLNNWDSKLSYSTLSLSVQEVKKLTEETPLIRTFGQEIVEGVEDSCRWLVEAVQDIVIFIASAIPVLILPAAAVVGIVLLVRAKIRKKRKSQSANDVEVDR